MRFRGVTRTTNRFGYATFTVPLGQRAGAYAGVGSVQGYVAARTTFRLLRPIVRR